MEHKSVSRWLALLPVILLLMAALVLPVTALAAPDTAVSVQPASQSVSTGAAFTVDVYVVPDTAIAGMQCYLSFDPSLLTATGVTEGNLLSQGGAATFFMAGAINNTVGIITGVAGAIIVPGQTVSSPGTFATISFTAKMATGTSPLTLSNVIVGNAAGGSVAVTVTSGNVTVGGAPTTYTVTFDTVPAATGTITFDSVNYNDGNTVDKAAATYNIVANPGSGYDFDHWVTTGSLSVASASSASTTCTVSGAGTLSMVQTPEQPTEYTVTFDTVPAATGTITFAAVTYSDGNSVNKAAATYNIAANPGSGYYFDHWVTSGSLSVASASSASTTCTVSGAGTLSMVQTQTPPVQYTVTFDTVPASTGTITFAAITYNDGNTVNKSAGAYAVTAHPGSGYYFDHWVTTGSLSVASASSASTTCTVSGAGTLSMVQTEMPPVGGTAYPPNKLLMLVPWIVLGAAIVAGATLFVRRRRDAAE
jgi:hypothetical protein